MRSRPSGFEQTPVAGDFGRMYLGDDREQAWGYEDSPSLAAVVDEPFRAGRYVILQHVGHGAMGNVYAAWDPDLDRKVAVKVLRDGGRPLPASLAREAKAMAKLTHPHVVTVFDVGMCDRGVFVAMEFVEGVTLRTWLKGQVRGWRDVLAAFVAAGEGLAAAHAGGVVHHDFKPDNVLVGHGGAVVKVADFGLARVALGTAAAVSGELSDTGTMRAVQVASVGSGSPTLASERGPVGTLAYMAPERHEARPADARSDQFSFCVALYEALYGQRPFAGSDVASLRHAVLTAAPLPAPKGTQVPARVAAALRRGLARAPEDRFASMAALLSALAEPRRRRLHWALAAGLVVGTSAVVLAGQTRDDRCAQVTADGDAWWQAHADGLPARVQDSYAAWHAGARETCAAGMRGELAPDLRLAREACFEQRLAVLRALVEQAASVPDQREALWAEAPVDGCEDPSVLLAVAPPPFEQRGEVAGVRGGLAQVGASEVAGAYAPARALLDGLQRRAEALGYAPLTAELLYARGRLEHYSGESARAVETLMAAIDEAEAQRHDRVAADAWGFVAEVAALGGLPEFVDWQRRARAARLRLTAGSRTVAATSDAQQVHPAIGRGLAALRAGDQAVAAEAFRGALAEPGLHPLLRAKLLLDLALALGDGDEAEAAWVTALAAYEDPRIAAPHRARAQLARGNQLFLFERYAEARGCFAAGVALLRESPMLSKQQLAWLRDAYRGIAIADAIVFELNAAGEAIAAAQQAQAAGGLAADPAIAEVAYEVHLLAGRPDEARKIAEDALALVRGRGAPPIDRALAHTHVGEALLWLGHGDAADREFTAALAIVADAELPEGDDTAAYAHKGRGLHALQAGATSEAIAALERATALWTATPCDCRDDAEARLGLALAYARVGDARGPALKISADGWFEKFGDEAAAHRDRLAQQLTGDSRRRAL